MDREKRKEINIEEVKKELLGLKVGVLTVQKYEKTDRNGHLFKCKCKCGNIVFRYASSLRRSYKNNCKSSCGCEKTGGAPTTHGATKTRLYMIWDGMKERCRNKKDNKYGGRGITICEEWEKDFTKFRDWSLANGYSDELTIDRINNDGNYEPSNCRWTTRKVQMNNRSVSVKYLYKGEMKTAEELANISGITSVAFVKRLKRGMSVDEAAETPKRYQYDRYINIKAAEIGNDR